MTTIQQVNELHRAARRRFTRQRTQMRGIDDTLQADLVEMIPYARLNRGMRYILTVINIFSKKAYAVPLRRKTGAEVKVALEHVLKSLGHSIRHIHTDRGREFYNGTVQTMLRQYGVRLYSTFTPVKAAICERFNRTLKNMLWKKFTIRRSNKWIDILPKLIADYNNTRHRTINMRPSDVNAQNESLLMFSYAAAAAKAYKPSKQKFVVGDAVRMSRYKHIFDKGYTPNWTAEVFKIRQVRSTTPITYLLSDWRGDDVDGAVYTEELQRAKYPDRYLVEKILRRRNHQVYVKWLGFDNKFNQWINADELLD